MSKRELCQQIFNQLPQKVRPYFSQGEVASYIPALSQVPATKFGASLSSINGESCFIGDCAENFSTQSISKALCLALALKNYGEDVWNHVGRHLSTSSFNSLAPLEQAGGTPRNPFTNAGAIAMVDYHLTRDKNYSENLLQFIHFLSGNDKITYDQSVAASEKETGNRNKAIAYLMKSCNILHNPVNDVLDTYFLQCSLSMSCNDLSKAFLFLANRGVVPEKGEQILTPLQCRRLNAMLLMFGAYNGAGDFVFRIGLPGKTGVGGGISVIAPGKASITVWSPALDEYGTSVAGLNALETIIHGCNLHIL